MTRIVDRAAWPRRELFDFFSPMSQPFFSVTFRQDVTRLYQFTKENRLSFYHSLVYLCTRAVNGVEAFRYALRGEDLVLFDRRNPSFTDRKPGAAGTGRWIRRIRSVCWAFLTGAALQKDIMGSTMAGTWCLWEKSRLSGRKTRGFWPGWIRRISRKSCRDR